MSQPNVRIVSQQISSSLLEFKLSVAHGELEIKTLKLKSLWGFTPTKCNVVLKTALEEKDKQRESIFSFDDGEIELFFEDSILLKEDYQLSINFMD